MFFISSSRLCMYYEYKLLELRYSCTILMNMYFFSRKNSKMEESLRSIGLGSLVPTFTNEKVSN